MLNKVRELDLGINIIFASKKIKNILKNTRRIIKRQKLPILEQANVIYEMKCKKCNTPISYIGETKRKLMERFKEHCSNSNIESNKSEPMTHAQQTHQNNSQNHWDIKILDRAFSDTDRKIKEAIQIKKLKPTLNRKYGITYIDIY